MRGLLGMLALLVLALSPVHAEEPALPPANPAELEKRAVRLDALFTRLASTDDADEGDTIVEEIWRVWLQSGRPEIDALMQNTPALLQAGEPRAAMPCSIPSLRAPRIGRRVGISGRPSFMCSMSTTDRWPTSTRSWLWSRATLALSPAAVSYTLPRRTTARRSMTIAALAP